MIAPIIFTQSFALGSPAGLPYYLASAMLGSSLLLAALFSRRPISNFT